jgi:hypothetical protein
MYVTVRYMSGNLRYCTPSLFFWFLSDMFRLKKKSNISASTKFGRRGAGIHFLAKNHFILSIGFSVSYLFSRP